MTDNSRVRRSAPIAYETSRLGRPRTTPFTVQRIRAALDQGRGVRETARLLKVSPAKVSEVRRMSATTTTDLHSV
jgi:hypothetical protein